MEVRRIRADGGAAGGSEWVPLAEGDAESRFVEVVQVLGANGVNVCYGLATRKSPQLERQGCCAACHAPACGLKVERKRGRKGVQLMAIQIEHERVFFGGDADVQFNIHGLPDSAGVVTVQAGRHQQTVTVNGSTGEVTVP